VLGIVLGYDVFGKGSSGGGLELTEELEDKVRAGSVFLGESFEVGEERGTTQGVQFLAGLSHAFQFLARWAVEVVQQAAQAAAVPGSRESFLKRRRHKRFWIQCEKRDEKLLFSQNGRQQHVQTVIRSLQVRVRVRFRAYSFGRELLGGFGRVRVRVRGGLGRGRKTQEPSVFVFFDDVFLGLGNEFFRHFLRQRFEAASVGLGVSTCPNPVGVLTLSSSWNLAGSISFSQCTKGPKASNWPLCELK
jgi:hypothetical protein